MKAIRVTEYGGPDVLKIEKNNPIPSNLEDNQVLVRVHAAGVNPVDTYILTGTFFVKPELPFTPGYDAAGIVEEVGDKVTKFKKNDRVFTAYKTITGTYAEYTICDENAVFPLSNKLTFAQGAALGIPYFTAYRALKILGKCKPKETVLIHGASGAVGIAAVQLAKEYGLTVMGTAGTSEGLDVIKHAGASYVYNHNSKDYCESILKATDGLGVNIILEMLANVNLDKDIRLLSQNGRVMVIGCRDDVQINPRILMEKEASVTGVVLLLSTESEWAETGEAIVSGLEAGWIKPVIGTEYPLENAHKAHVDIMSSKGAKGVNPVDTYIRSGVYRYKPELPYTPGHDCAGVVESIGSNVTKFKKDDRVFTAFSTLTGAYAEYTVCHENNLFPLNEKLSFSQGAALSVPYFTAYKALMQIAEGKPNETVLVHGASGAVGTAAVQIARHFGLTVFGTAGSEIGMELVKNNGAHYVFNHNSENYIQDIMTTTEGLGVNVILEMLANVNLAKDIELVSRNGRVAVIGCRGEIKINPRILMEKEASVRGVMLGASTKDEQTECGKAILSGIQDGWVKPFIGKEYPLEKAAEAHDDIIKSKSTKGKLVLIM